MFDSAPKTTRGGLESLFIISFQKRKEGSRITSIDTTDNRFVKETQQKTSLYLSSF